MKTYKIINNQLIIYNNGKEFRNATEEQKECYYCKENGNCERNEKKSGGSGCDGMKCIYSEL